jgi:PAS domain S-box-containing protein
MARRSGTSDQAWRSGNGSVSLPAPAARSPTPGVDFKLLFEQSPGVLLVLAPDAAFTILAMTDVRVRVTHRRREDVIGRGLFEAFPDNPKDPHATGARNLRASLERVLATRAPDTMPVQKYDIALPESEGGDFEERYWSPTNTPVLSEDGQVRYILHQVEDVTDVVRLSQQGIADRAEVRALREIAEAQRALHESQERLRLVVEASGAGTWELDVVTQVFRGDARQSALLGLPANASQPLERVMQAIHPEDRERTARVMAAALAGEQGGRYHVELRTAGLGGAPARWLEGRGQAYFGPDGKPMRLMGTTVEITERKAGDAERQRLLEYLNRGDACAVLDARSHFVFVNESYEKMTRRSREELLGKNHWEVFPAGLGTEYETQFRRVMRERVEAQFEEYYAPYDVWTAVTAYPTGEGGVAFFIRDTTGRRRAEEELARLAVIVEVAPEFIGVYRLDGSALFLNSSGRRLVGLDSLEQVRSTQVLEYFTPESLPAVPSVLEEALRQGQSRREMNFRHFKTGEAIPFLWQVIALKDSRTGEPIAFATVSHDLREQKRHEAELQRRAHFEQQLIGIVSHDLKNPISAITMSAATVLRRSDLEERLRKPLGRILSSAERATRMIRDLLDFTQARLGEGLPIQPEAMDFHALTRQVVDEIRDANPERVLHVEQQGDGHGAWDGDRMAQVLGNLLSNALHYSPAGTPVRVRTRGDESAVVLEVHNEGASIPDELLSRLFQPMQRGASAHDGSARSVGLGLYIVDQVVRAHGGQVDVRSTGAEGTTFRVRLPRVVPSAAD